MHSPMEAKILADQQEILRRLARVGTPDEQPGDLPCKINPRFFPHPELKPEPRLPE